ncbi:MAG: metal-dependent transcriptional regulator [Capnocytophaga sp.]|nr:metal-dependent transcriptional regulator [Capnocytophaga sp.]
MTLSEENYLKTIFHLSAGNIKEVTTNAIAEAMNTKASSVTDMLKKLSEKDLVRYKRYQGTLLSECGRLTAVKIIRKHRLWEVFLVEKLDFSWEEVHDIAEELEHVKSDKLVDKLDAFLGYPSTDPHGDPIPSRDGVLQLHNNPLLSDLVAGDKAMCIGVKDTSVEFLRHLNKLSLGLGNEILVIDKERFDQSMTIAVDGNNITISALVSRNIYIEKINKKR